MILVTLLGAIGSFEPLLLLFILLLAFLLPILALVDIVKSRFEGNNKLIWVIIVIFTSIIGAIIYFIIGRKQKIKN